MARLAPLAQESLRDRVLSAVRNAVVRGEFRLGEKVSEAELAEQLGVSRTPVREALRVLEYQGLVVTRSKAGTYIAAPDASVLRDGLMVRATLEQLALREVMLRGGDEGWSTMCDQLDDLLDRMDASARGGDEVRTTEADFCWHELLVTAAGNAPLARAWHTVGSPTLVWSAEIRQYPLERAAWVIVLEQHQGLLTIFRRGDVEESARAIEEHIMGKLDAASMTDGPFP